MNTYNIYNTDKNDNTIECTHLRRLYDIGQYWCAENHDILHCDENCPFIDNKTY